MHWIIKKRLVFNRVGLGNSILTSECFLKGELRFQIRPVPPHLHKLGWSVCQFYLILFIFFNFSFMHRERPHAVKWSWRQHTTLTSSVAHSGHTRALNTELDSQVTHCDMDRGACVHICCLFGITLPDCICRIYCGRLNFLKK